LVVAAIAMMTSVLLRAAMPDCDTEVPAVLEGNRSWRWAAVNILPRTAGERVAFMRLLLQQIAFVRSISRSRDTTPTSSTHGCIPHGLLPALLVLSAPGGRPLEMRVIPTL